MIDISQFRPETLLIAGIVIGIFLGTIVGIFAAGLASYRRRREAFEAGRCHAERVIHQRLVIDRRDDTPLVFEHGTAERYDRR
jgi:hypothetical protein